LNYDGVDGTYVWDASPGYLSSGEYRFIQSDFQFLESTELTYNSITDFIDNRPNAVAVALGSPVFKPQQYYLIGYAQDSWRVSSRLSLELGLRGHRAPDPDFHPLLLLARHFAPQARGSGPGRMFRALSFCWPGKRSGASAPRATGLRDRQQCAGRHQQGANPDLPAHGLAE
jgi:hypothetical protein